MLPAVAFARRSGAESVERGGRSNVSSPHQSTYWTQNQARVSQALERIRQLVPSHTRGRGRMRESRTYGSGRGACHEMHVPTATDISFDGSRPASAQTPSPPTFSSSLLFRATPPPFA